MFGGKEKIDNHSSASNAGRVINLKKILAPELSAEVDNDVLPSAPAVSPKKFRLFGRHDQSVNFLKSFTLQEKEEAFIEEELMREYLDEVAEDRKRHHLSSFFKYVSFSARLWWLPLVILKIVWRLFWRTRRLALLETAVIPTAKADKKDSLVLKKRQPTVKDIKPKSSLADFAAALFSWPKSILNFITGRTTEDYLYQRVLLDEITRSKFHPFKHFLSFAVIVFVVLLPIKVLSYYKVVNLDDFKGRVLGVSERAVGNLGSAADSVSSLDLSGARENFSLAKESFSEAEAELNNVNALLLEIGKILPNKKVRLASHAKEILAAGEAASSLGENLSLAADSFFSSSDKNFSVMIGNFLKYENLALADANRLNENLAKIDVSSLPEEYQNQFVELKASGQDLEMILSSASDMVKKINIFLGAGSDKRYIFVFENNSEMRASGGFIGSFALVDFSQGKIKNIEVPNGGSYDTEGGLKKLITAPEPLWLVNPLWHFWDANWWPDWKKSASKLTWFYEKSGGPTVDGVIAFTPTVLERLLKISGPIDMTDKYGVVMDSENLWVNLRDIIEKEKTEDMNVSYEIAEKKPKRVISDLFGRLMEELPKRLNRENFPQLLSVLNDSLVDKQVLFYFTDEELQNEAETRNWAGRIKETGKDYLMTVNTNIAGGKSDGKMEEKVSHEAEIMEDGSIVDTLVITRTHKGVVDEPYYGVRNVDWLRVYVPLGSELLEASGFRGPDPIYFEFPDKNWEIDEDVAAEEGANAFVDEKNLNTKIYQESGKTVFANWNMVDPGQEVVIRLKYKLPFKLEKKLPTAAKTSSWEAALDKFIKVEKKDLYVYSLMVQKQAGSRFASIESSLKAPGVFKTVWKYPENLKSANGWEVKEDFNSDKYWAVLFEKNQTSE